MVRFAPQPDPLDRIADLLPRMTFPEGVDVAAKAGGNRLAVELQPWVVTARHSQLPFAVRATSRWEADTVAAAADPDVDLEELAKLIVDEVAVQFATVAMHEFIEFT